MLNLTRNWWLLVLRGLLAIAFGVIAFLRPGVAWLSLIVFFGTYALLDGAFAMMTGLISSKFSPRWWTFLLEGVISVAAGAIALLRPELASVVLVLVIAIWAVLTGILEIAAAIRLRREITNEWMLGFGGFISIALGMSLFLQPATGGLIIALMVGVYVLIFGILLLVLGLRLRKWNMPASGSDTLRTARS